MSEHIDPQPAPSEQDETTATAVDGPTQDAAPEAAMPQAEAPEGMIPQPAPASQADPTHDPTAAPSDPSRPSDPSDPEAGIEPVPVGVAEAPEPVIRAESVSADPVHDPVQEPVQEPVVQGSEADLSGTENGEAAQVAEPAQVSEVDENNEVSAAAEQPTSDEPAADRVDQPVESADPADGADPEAAASGGADADDADRDAAAPTDPVGPVEPEIRAQAARALDRLEAESRDTDPAEPEGTDAAAQPSQAAPSPGPAEPGPAVATVASREPTETVESTEPAEGADAPRPETPRPHAPAAPTPAPPLPTPMPTPSPAAVAAAASAVSGAGGAVVPSAPVGAAPRSDSAKFGRVADDGTVYVRTPEGEKAVGSYPGAPAEEALAYFARKFDEVDSLADLLYQRVTQTDLSAKDAAESLAKLREASVDLHAVGDLVALQAKVENIATALEARRVVESEQRAAARAEAMAKREEIVAEAECIAAQPESKVQWKSSSARMRALLDEWKAAQRGGPKLDRESEQALWQRLSSSRNSFDKMRRVHFAQLGSAQSQAKAAKEELVEEAEKLAASTDWGATAGAYKRLMDRWRQAGRASRAEDDALWKRFKAAQDSFFNAKDAVVAAENEEFRANLVVKEELLTQAQALLPVKNLEAAKSALRGIQEKWDAAGKVPRADMDRIEKAMRRVEQTVREAEDKRWKATNPEVAARAASLASQAEAALERYRKDLDKAQASGDERRIAKAREALEAREAWLKQARAGLAAFGG